MGAEQVGADDPESGEQGVGRIPRRLDTVVARMHEHGVVFAPASGRQLANLRATLGTTITQSI